MVVMLQYLSTTSPSTLQWLALSDWSLVSVFKVAWSSLFFRENLSLYIFMLSYFLSGGDLSTLKYALFDIPVKYLAI